MADVEGAVLDEISSLSRIDGPEVPIKDLELRLEDRGYTDSQTRRAKRCHFKVARAPLTTGGISLSMSARLVSQTSS